MPSWDPAIYERYKVYRDRPALDLLLQVPADLDPREIWDLGCGTGEHAAVLAARHPAASVWGLDSSPEMLEAARRRQSRVRWVQGDAAAFAPETAPDLIFTNAALHWIGDHQALFPRLAGLLAPGGVLACQMPQTWPTAWHVVLRETAAEPAWAERLAGVVGVRQVAEPETYYDWLAPVCAVVDIWSTTYLHVLQGDDPVVDWMMGTALRPYLDALPEPAMRSAFLDAYRDRVAKVVPARADGTTLFPFPRLFILARK
jgi:trans-aconitate 2-methyltransferase